MPANDPNSVVLDQRYYDGAGRLVQSGPGDQLPASYKAALASHPDLAQALFTTQRRYDADERMLTEHPARHVQRPMVHSTPTLGKTTLLALTLSCLPYCQQEIFSCRVPPETEETPISSDQLGETHHNTYFGVVTCLKRDLGDV